MKIGIIGISGKVGLVLADFIAKDPCSELTGGISSANSRDDLENLTRRSDVMIDFSSPASTVLAADVASSYKVPFVSGTTDLSEDNIQKIRAFSRNIPILRTSNFSVGVQLMAILLKTCSKILKNFDVSIIDKHHNRKKDSPSGTALFLAQQIDKNVQIVSTRAGNLVGDHVCDFCGENEMLTISHRALNRNLFAEGALNCAKWIVGKEPGIYTMQDYINAQNRDKNN